jgi:hypothetical protein
MVVELVVYKIMLNKILFIFLLTTLLPFKLFSQEENERLLGIIKLYGEGSRLNSQSAFSIGGSGNFIFKDHFVFGLYINANSSMIRKDYLNDNNMKLDFVHGGILLQYMGRIKENTLWTIGARGGYADISLQRESLFIGLQSEKLYGANAFVLQPEVSVIFDFSKIFAFEFSAAYRISQTKSPIFSNAELSSLCISAGINFKIRDF